jgi:hypothetical protein
MTMTTVTKPRFLPALDDANGDPYVLILQPNVPPQEQLWCRLRLTDAMKLVEDTRVALNDALSPEPKKAYHVVHSIDLDGLIIFIARDFPSMALIRSSEPIGDKAQWSSVGDELMRLAELNEACERALGLAATWREDHRDERDM